MEVGAWTAAPRGGEKVSPVPRRCTVCDHPEGHGIDEVLVTGTPYRSVAKRFGLSESAVYRHKGEHLPARQLKGREVELVAQALNEGLVSYKCQTGFRLRISCTAGL